MHRYWMVHRFVGGNTPTKIHATKAEAMEEAERLARLHVGVEFVLLEAVGSCAVDVLPVKWTEAHE